MSIHNTFEPCPSCYYLYASHWYGDGLPEIHCSDCGFTWQGSIGNLSPDDEAEKHRLNRQALEELRAIFNRPTHEEEATAHRGLRDEAIAYQDPEDYEEER